VSRTEPTTAAGKALLDRYAWQDEIDDMTTDILAIEAEARAESAAQLLALRHGIEVVRDSLRDKYGISTGLDFLLSDTARPVEPTGYNEGYVKGRDRHDTELLALREALDRHGNCTCPAYQKPYIEKLGRHAPDCDVDEDARALLRDEPKEAKS
jgi:hypothetical protein